MCLPCALRLLSLGRKGRTCVAEAVCSCGAWGWRHPGMVAGEMPGGAAVMKRKPGPAGRACGEAPCRAGAKQLWEPPLIFPQPLAIEEALPGVVRRTHVSEQGWNRRGLTLGPVPSALRLPRHQLPLRLGDFHPELQIPARSGSRRQEPGNWTPSELLEKRMWRGELD